MAATDQHYRHQRTLDIVFGLSCLAMLVTTVWMFADDYLRGYKRVQTTFRHVEAGLAERDMVEKLPDPQLVVERREALRAARDNLKAQWNATVEEQDDKGNTRTLPLKDLDLELKAKRERADLTYRDIKADFDAQASYYNIAIDEAGKAPLDSSRYKAVLHEAELKKKKLDALEVKLNKAKDDFDRIETEYRNKVTDRIAPAEKAIADADDQLKRVTGTFDRYAKLASSKNWTFGDTFRELPIIDGFESPTKIKQIWLPDLTIDYSFKDVPRFDRCTSCHLGIDRAAYTREALTSLGDRNRSRELSGKLTAAQKMLERREQAGEKLGFDPRNMPGERTLPSVLTGFKWGMQKTMSDSTAGWLNLSLLLLASVIIAAGSLGLLERSVFLGIKVAAVGVGLSVLSLAGIALIAPVRPTVKTVELTQGEVTQYCAHPRLDLFVDSNSPHPMEKFGCTICHSGQGSATEFTLASHTPDSVAEEKKWKKEYGWESIHFWDYPMQPRRFVESSCLKCHHQVTDLIRHGSKEEAPKLLRGFNLLKENGCFGCHEIQGVKGGRWVGPDLRLEPQPALELLTAAEQERAKSDPTNPPGTLRKVGPSLRRLAEKTNELWTRKWVYDPRGFRPDTKMPHFYNHSTSKVENLPDDQKPFPAAEVNAIAHYLLTESKASLRGQDTYRQALLAGRKNLHELQTELTKGALSDKDMKELSDVSRRFVDLALLSAPTQARSINADGTRQRQLQERLQELHRKAAGLPEAAPAAKTLKTQISTTANELSTVTESLVRLAKPVSIADRIVVEDGSTVSLPEKEGTAANGRRLFTERGCLACHAHEGTTKRTEGGAFNDTVTSDASFGPELSRIGDKLAPVADKVTARRWLVQWILNPNIYHPRTRMPITHLSVGEANDVATWLLSQKSGWKGEEPSVPSSDGTGRTPTLADFKALARVYLAKAPGMTRTDTDRFLPAEGDSMPGIPKDRLATTLRDADERALEAGKVTLDRLKWYIGRKAIGREGCYACHDIPGFETAKPIGTGLNDWGKKDPDRIAFEDAETWVKEHYSIVPGRTTRKDVEERIRGLWEKGAASLGAAQKDELMEWLKSQNISHIIRTQEGTETAAGAREEVVLHQKQFDLIAEAEGNLDRRDRNDLKRLKEQITSQRKIVDLERKKLKKGLSSAEERELQRLLPGRFFEPMRVTEDGKQVTLPPYEGFFFEALEHHHREGFLHLKLMEPRSYDFNRLKTWDDRLRMPQFRFARSRQQKGESDEQYHARLERDEAEAREAVMTFILGLVADPIPLKYLANPNPDKQAETIGRQVLDKYNCAGCHQVRPGVYDFRHEDVVRLLDESFRLAAGPSDASIKSDFHSFLNHNGWYGSAPASDRLMAIGYLNADATTKAQDIKALAGTDAIRLAEAIRFHGADRVARDIQAGSFIYIPKGKYSGDPGFGGTFTNLLIPYLMRKDATKYPKDDEGKSRGVLPPSLHREGERVQPDWLYKFLLNPGIIRPADYMTLRMPRFNMSPEEARALVNYFAAASRLGNPGAGVTYPYVAIDQREADYWKHASGEYQTRLENAGTETARLEKEQADVQKRLANPSSRTKEADTKRLADLKTLIASSKELAKLAKAQLAEKPPKASKIATDLYSRQAYKLLTNKDLCLKCHEIGHIKIEGPQGPNLAQAAERLRPEWMVKWIANPPRMFTYQPVMPQNFPNDPDPLKWKYQETFIGSPLQQSRAVRDILMDTPRLTDLLVTQPPPALPTPEGDKKK
jgi:mono/diheme cytochrome c family protein